MIQPLSKWKRKLKSRSCLNYFPHAVSLLTTNGLKEYVPIYNNIKYARKKYSVQQADFPDVFLNACLMKKRRERAPS
ncbi:hypothetical protein PUN28_015960 [Cardiocondyla obscurior]|uniref:Uncharacterized protein n=1 Tax=Cardiocondyla obscurior TaxID=286306 RepID=A0AAW2EQ98_9HYME